MVNHIPKLHHNEPHNEEEITLMSQLIQWVHKHDVLFSRRWDLQIDKYTKV